MTNEAVEKPEAEAGDEMEQCKQSGGSNMNPHLRSMKHDVLYHLAISTHSSDLKELFGDVKVMTKMSQEVQPGICTN